MSLRGLLFFGFALFIVALIYGQIGPESWNWIRVVLLLAGLIGVFVIMTVPDHFLVEHLWKHVLVQHMPRVFAWILAALTATRLLDNYVQVESFFQDNSWMMLALASVLGIVPESGPHLFFVMLYDQGTIPLSVLTASSIVQDGHGTLPLLAHSCRDFLVVKSINLVVGVIVGALLLATGW